MIHEPVLLKESVELLTTKLDGIYFDGTAGFGGHSSEILKRISYKGRLIATDKDNTAFNFCKNKFANESRFSIYNTSFNNIDTIAKLEFIEKFDGIFADLGVSSFQLDNVEAGFTFREDSSLDLRMNKQDGFTASDFLNNASQEEIANVLFQFGEEKNSRIISKKIIELRNKEKIISSKQIVDLIKTITPERFITKTLSRVFQALRIYINDELNELKKFLTKAVDLLADDGRIGIITFHSLEDRIIKEFFKYESLTCICPAGTPICICNKKQTLKIITKKPIVPSEEEIKSNKRSRSAKLRVAQKIKL
ncbi:MAG: 16S rRNA (cytosine(1402)-N(4))-methyltransferase RsmH [Melioribacteraceae bacterium]|nr:16S rRNA (cytosine(1402)-N(4))-methyltransferase RsmH [Melioribacteraceae bacterium]